jgi:hydroxymethylpyrimidine/phosphomethylpyrimidine kinase
MREMLLPQTTLITPNAPEARRLAESDEDERRADDRCLRPAPASTWARNMC